MDTNEKSCVGCAYLYAQDYGYSNYTVTDTDMDCALNSNPNLPADEPYDWKQVPDNWPATNNNRCSSYVSGEQIRYDVDGDYTAKDFTDDLLVIRIVDQHAGKEGT